MQVQKMYKQEEISGIRYLYDAFLASLRSIFLIDQNVDIFVV